MVTGRGDGGGSRGARGGAADEVLARIGAKAERLEAARLEVERCRDELDAEIGEAYRSSRLPLQKLAEAGRMNRSTVYVALKRSGAID